MKTLPLLIDGQSLLTDKTFSVENPADGSVVGLAALAGAQEAKKAVESATRAWADWAAISISERANSLREAADRIGARSDELSRLYTLEQGKPLSDARVELERVGAYFRSYADMAPLLRKELADATPAATTYFAWQPVGVVGLILPWNSPLVLGAIKLPAALLAGNAVVLKPPTYVPLCWLKTGEILRDVFPPGVFNIVTGPGSTVGETLVGHKAIGMISFTGDTATGKRIMAAASGNLKKLTLECGGNDAAILLEDAPIDEVHIERLVAACFRNAGSCAWPSSAFSFIDPSSRISVSGL